MNGIPLLSGQINIEGKEADDFEKKKKKKKKKKKRERERERERELKKVA